MKLQLDKKIIKIIPYFFTITIIFIMLFSGCSKNQCYRNVENTLEYLTSDELSGRFVGSEGNRKTQEYIINSLIKNNIKEYNDTYEDQFKYEILEPINAKIHVEEKSFEANSDFFVQNICKFSGNYPIVKKENIKDNCILLLDEKDKAYDFFDNENVMAILIHSSSPSNYIPRTETISEKLVLSLNFDTYNYLSNNIGSDIYIECNYEVTEKSDSNIIGIIEGKNAKKAIVISAHFDHIGSKGGYIFRGALDNASGVTALLDIASNLSEKIDEAQYPVDIIFSFFNAEEIGLFGSKSFAEKVQLKYGNNNVLNINIDCVGDKESNNIKIFHTSGNITNFISDFFIQDITQNSTLNVLASEKIESISDNKWFQNQIYLYEIQKYIHTTEDAFVKINPIIIEQISNGITNSILELVKNPIEEDKDYQEVNEHIHIYMEEADVLKPFEYKFIKLNNEITYKDNKTVNGNYYKIKKYFNNKIRILSKSLQNDDYYKYISVCFDAAPDIIYDNHELDEVFMRNYQYKDISYIDLIVTTDLKFNSERNGETKQIIKLSIIKVDTENDRYTEQIDFYRNLFGDEMFEYNDYKMYYKNDASRGNVSVLNTMIKPDNDAFEYIYDISFNNITEFDKKQLIELVEKYDLLTTLNLMKNFTNTNGETDYLIS